MCVRFITGGLFVGLPEQIPRSSMLTEADLQYYASQYKERGFRLQIFQLPVDCVSVCSPTNNIYVYYMKASTVMGDSYTAFC